MITTRNRRWTKTMLQPSENGGTGQERLLQFIENQVETDCEALSRALTELAHGDLTPRLSLSSTPLDPAEYPGMERWVEVLNRFVARLQKSAAEFNVATEPPCHRLCYVGADSYLEGITCGEAMAKALGGSGRIIILYRQGLVSHEQRRRGFQTALLQRSPGVQILAAVDCPPSAEEAFNQTVSVLRDFPSVDGIYLTLGTVPPAVARAVQEQGKAGRTKIICHDLADETLRYIEQGVITASLSEDAYAQGHDPVIHLFNRLVAGWEPPTARLLTVSQLATRENCSQFWREGHRVRTATAQSYAKPVDRRPPRPLKIAVLGRAPNSFWDQVKEGVLAAAAELKPYDATAEWIVPEENLRDRSVSAAVYGPLLESLVQQGYQGIATAIPDPAFVLYVNRATQMGIPVITFDSEPSGLSSMVVMITEQASRLMELSRRLANAVDHVTQSTSQIKSAMDQVSQGTNVQSEKVNQATSSLDSMLHRMDAVTTQANDGAAAAETAAEATRVGTESVSTTLGSMQQIHRSVVETANAVEKLGSSSEKIDVIVKLIGGVAYQIKLLGINAAIEAAHAGDYGAGFSVVAREIRSLADRSTQATRDITAVVQTVEEGIDQVLKVMRTELQEVKSGAERAENASRVLGGIGESVEDNMNRLATIATASTQLQSFSHELGAAIHELTSITEENAASAEEVGASTNEVLTELGAVNNLARSLADMASGTLKSLAKFNTTEDRSV